MMQDDACFHCLHSITNANKSEMAGFNKAKFNVFAFDVRF